VALTFSRRGELIDSILLVDSVRFLDVHGVLGVSVDLYDLVLVLHAVVVDQEAFDIVSDCRTDRDWQLVFRQEVRLLDASVIAYVAKHVNLVIEAANALYHVRPELLREYEPLACLVAPGCRSEDRVIE